MSKLPYLVREVNNGVEVFFSGRAGGAYLKTAYVLCDDYAELASKTFLLAEDPTWSDAVQGGRFKGFRTVLREAATVIQTKRVVAHAAVDAIRLRMEGRRDRRNNFFHSTQLLDMNLHELDCVTAFVDLLDYCELLFPNEWTVEVSATANLESYDALLHALLKGQGDPAVFTRLNDLLGNWPAMIRKVRAKGAEVTQHSEDLHLRMCIRNGGKALRDKLRAL